MNRIFLLSEQVANQIAAGEVIERPASVLKELVENSLDSGATQIDIEIRAGGRSLVGVIDNGCGMSRDDALLCLERHATSKLRVSDDLNRLTSYGFRGEAIPSIASISKFRLRTRETASLAGTELILDGGKLMAVKDVGLALGTQIEVRSLFYNLPARRKFLRTESTESAHLRHTLLLAGLARPEVGFSISFDEQRPQRWLAGESLRERILSIFGEEWSNLIVPVEAHQGDFHLHGFIGKPGVSRAARSEELFFVNQRPVENRTLHYGLLEGYHNSLMKGRYPLAVLFLEMDPAGVDVNIHPAKREVRFHDDFQIRYFVVKAVQETLRQFSGAPAAGFTFIQPDPVPHLAQLPLEKESIAPFDIRTSHASPSHESIGPAFSPSPASPQTSLSLPELAPPPPQYREESFISNRLGLRVFGCVAQLYLIAESTEGLVLIDQHAAHERVLFEQMLHRVARQIPSAQQLLFPATVELPPRETDFMLAQMESLQQIGVGISLFGTNRFIIDALPPMIQPREVGDFIRTLVSDLQKEGGETRKARRLSEDVVAKTVCRHAVKANDPLKPAEWDQLVRDLLNCELPYTCPHGRPTMIQLSRGELEKKFGRAV